MTEETKNKISKAKTAYRKRFCDAILDYYICQLNNKLPNGIVRRYPDFADFALRIGVTVRTIQNWRKEYPKFDEACEMCEELKRAELLNAGITFKAHASFAKFVLSSQYGMREKVEITHDDTDISIPKEMEELIQQRQRREKQ